MFGAQGWHYTPPGDPGCGVITRESNLIVRKFSMGRAREETQQQLREAAAAKKAKEDEAREKARAKEDEAAANKAADDAREQRTLP